MAITQLESELLIKEEKVFSDLAKPLSLGPAPICWTRELQAVNSSNTFYLIFIEAVSNYRDTQLINVIGKV